MLKILFSESSSRPGKLWRCLPIAIVGRHQISFQAKKVGSCADIFQPNVLRPSWMFVALALFQSLSKLALRLFAYIFPVHPVFHVSLLEPHVANTFPGRVVAPPPPLDVDGLPEFEVQKILDTKFFRRKLYYFVDWVGYNVSDQSWEPAINLLNAQLEIYAFHLEFPLKPRPPVISN